MNHLAPKPNAAARFTAARFALFSALSSALCLSPAAAASQPRVVVAAVDNAAAERDGRHDFDFLIGSWHVHHRRLRHALAHSTEWYGFDGTCLFRTVLDFANMDENVLDMPSKRVYGVTVRFYNRSTHEWSIYWGTDKLGDLALPATVGKFDEHGIGRFYDHETFEGKPIVVRYTWTHPTPNAPHWEQAFSSDGGKTWETNWTSDFTR